MTLSPARSGLVARSFRRAAAGAAVTAAAVTLLAGGFPASAAVSSHGPRQARNPACRRATGPFHVQGTKVVGAHGKVFIPYGITVPGLANKDYHGIVPLDLAKISATASFWCANTVRLQLGQANLIGARQAKTFLRDVAAEVKVAEKAGMVVVLNDQTEDEGDQLAPNSATVTFWKDLTRIYGHDKQVIFDLFNQPRVFMQLGCGDNADWAFWRRGGLFKGHEYVGMQSLLNRVRAAGARNVIWAEGPCFANSLAGLRGHLLTGHNVVYAYQHPKGDHDAAQWFSDFGWVVFRRIAPVVDADWTNFAANKGECWPDAPKAVPLYLRYLQSHGIGLTAFQLKRGVLIKTKDLTDPTRIFTKGKLKWQCANNLDEGAGADLLRWYRQRNS